MIHWKDIDSSSKFRRKKVVEGRYLIYKEFVHSMGYTLSEWLKTVYLSHRNHLIVKNRFPYNFEKKILHYVLFSRHNLSNYKINYIVKKFLKKNFNRKLHFKIHYNNDKSVKDLEHYHIFVHLSP